jgi:hypothetical protein
MNAANVFGFTLFLIGLVFFIVIMLVGAHDQGKSVGRSEGRQEIRQEAFERRYMVQCIGKTGYYWECEENE